MKKFIKIASILGLVVSVSYIIYRKILNYITLDEDSETVFESLKTHNKIPDNLIMYIGIALIIISILGIIITLRIFSRSRSNKKPSKKNKKFEDIYS